MREYYGSDKKKREEGKKKKREEKRLKKLNRKSGAFQDSGLEPGSVLESGSVPPPELPPESAGS